MNIPEPYLSLGVRVEREREEVLEALAASDSSAPALYENLAELNRSLQELLTRRRKLAEQQRFLADEEKTLNRELKELVDQRDDLSKHLREAEIQYDAFMSDEGCAKNQAPNRDQGRLAGQEPTVRNTSTTVTRNPSAMIEASLMRLRLATLMNRIERLDRAAADTTARLHECRLHTEDGNRRLQATDASLAENDTAYQQLLIRIEGRFS